MAHAGFAKSVCVDRALWERGAGDVRIDKQENDEH